MATITRQVRDIHQAFHYRQMDVIQAMLTETPTLVDAVDAGGRTLLHRAVWWDEIDLVALLLEHGARADIKNASGNTALNIALDVNGVKNPHKWQIIRLLAEHGVDAFAPVRNDRFLAFIAIQYNNAELVRAIFKRNPSEVNHACCNGKSPLSLAIEYRHTEIISLLCKECGANPNACLEQGTTYLHSRDVVSTLAVVRALIEGGANVNAEGWQGETPLLLACFLQNSLGLVRLLLDAGARPNIVSRGDNCGTPLHNAAGTAGNTDVVRLLLDSGIDVDMRDRRSETALMRATRAGLIGTVRLLLSRGADVRAGDFHDNTALHRAVAEGHAHTVSMLLDAGADLRRTQRLWNFSFAHRSCQRPCGHRTVFVVSKRAVQN